MFGDINYPLDQFSFPLILDNAKVFYEFLSATNRFSICSHMHACLSFSLSLSLPLSQLLYWGLRVFAGWWARLVLRSFYDPSIYVAVVLQEPSAGNIIFFHPDSKPGSSQGSVGSLCEFQVLVTPPRTSSWQILIYSKRRGRRWYASNGVNGSEVRRCLAAQMALIHCTKELGFCVT